MNNQYDNSRATGSVRQPVSCEPCRRRKIKCSRSRPPCDTCRRRRCPDSCVYKAPRDSSPLIQDNNSNSELLDRISNLENLLRKHTSAVAKPLPGGAEKFTGQIRSPPIQPGPLFQPSPESLISESASTQISNESTSSRGVGALSTCQNGNVRYQPHSSQWRSILANTHFSIGTPSLEDSDESRLEIGFPFTTAASPSEEELLSILPPAQHCDYLKERYFTVFSPLFHILHDPTFQSQYEQFVANPSSISLSWLAILFVLLSLAVTTLEEDDPVLRDLTRGYDACHNIRTLSKRYREAAMKCLTKQGVLWGKHDIHSLQTLILIIYAMGHSQEPTWILLGMTYHIAIAMACHIDPDEFNLNYIQSEERRRCWAGLIMLYTIQNTTMGNPDPSWRITNNVKPPQDVNDADITVAGIQEPITGPTQMSYLILKFRLYDIAAKICQETFKSSPPSHSTIQSLDHQVCLAQQEWERRYHADSNLEALPIHHAVHLHILHAYSHQLFLLLHRPFFAQSILGLETPNDSQIRCIASAEALLDIYQTLCDTEDFRPYKWYTNGIGSFHAFHGAVVLSVALLMPIYRPQHQKFKRVLNEALVRFERSSGRSTICEKATRILRHLLSTSSPPLTTPPLTTPGSDHDTGDEFISNEQLRMFAERLQPQQWLAPTSMAWAEWDSLMVNASEIHV